MEVSEKPLRYFGAVALFWRRCAIFIAQHCAILQEFPWALSGAIFWTLTETVKLRYFTCANQFSLSSVRGHTEI